ncbi:trypsin, alkaline C [Bombyx mori]|uniref:Peptidase S1 domain-containing protein n=1 Tax=Bombyx mori TaxID=7091 RepID=A0A8R2AQC8_BOMMO|nr:trypsin, alkaline C [Bombyx mori]
MNSIIILLALGLAAVAAVPTNPQRIIGGSTTTIDRYPGIVSLLFTRNWSQWWQNCGGNLLNQRSVLSAAHCTFGDQTAAWRFRVGSTWANSGGVVHLLNRIIYHPNYNRFTADSDLCILRSSTNIVLNNNVRPVNIAGANYNLADNQPVWAAGWGATSLGGSGSEQLRHVQVWTINQNTCAQRYRPINRSITANMLCSGVLDVGGRDQCQGDSGGPLLHNNVLVGVCSWGQYCADRRYPGVNVRVSRFTSWIQSNA